MRSKIALHGQNANNRLTDKDGDMSGVRDPRGSAMMDRPSAMDVVEGRAKPLPLVSVDRSDGRRNPDYDSAPRSPQVEEPTEYRDEYRNGMAGGAPRDSFDFDVVTPQPTYGGPPDHSSRR